MHRKKTDCHEVKFRQSGYMDSHALDSASSSLTGLREIEVRSFGLNHTECVKFAPLSILRRGILRVLLSACIA